MTIPSGIVAELTYRCPLHCVYCSNPINLGAYRDELTGAEWQRVLEEARALGVVQAHFSGGEPLLRRDLEELVARASALGFYSNLITSALGLSAARAERLQAAGLDHVQISFQAAEGDLSNQIAGTPGFPQKVQAARMVKELGMPLTINVVLHRKNLDSIEHIIHLAEEVQADRLELANTQYYGWALKNRTALLPTMEQLQHAEEVVAAARMRLGKRMMIIYVIPDYYSRFPKPCMGGWGSSHLIVTPNGNVLPCLAAAQLPDLPSVNVREHTLPWIWQESPLFNRFRGYDWMPEPCKGCPRREIDFGGCRCQAFQLTGDAAATDPVCHLSPHHSLIEAAVHEANHLDRDSQAFLYRPKM